MRAKQIFPPLSALAAAALLLTGCGTAATAPEIPPPDTGAPQTADAPADTGDRGPSDTASIDLETATLYADVVALSEGGVTARPVTSVDTPDGGAVASVPLEDDSSDVEIVFTDSTGFFLLEIDADTYEKNLYPAQSSDVKKTTSIHVWGTYAGPELTADRVVITRFV